MHKVKQTTPDNCFQACVASIFELPIEKVPDFMAAEPGVWYDYFILWLDAYGMWPAILKTAADAYHHNGVPCYSIASCTVKGVRRRHTVVMYNGEIVWDPGPDGRTIVEVIDQIYFIAKDPAKISQIPTVKFYPSELPF